MNKCQFCGTGLPDNQIVCAYCSDECGHCARCGKAYDAERLVWIHNLHEWVCWDCVDSDPDLLLMG